MPYKVLNVEWEKVIVDQIDPTIHKHLSWRDFNENDACIKEVVKEHIEIIDIEEEVIENFVSDKVEELTLQEAKEQYKEKFWAYPKGNPKLETIISKL